MLRVLRELLYHEPEGRGTDITGALQYLARVVRRRAVVFVVSDFLGDGYEKALAVAGRRHDTVAIRMSDPRERQLPTCRVSRTRGCRNGRTRDGRCLRSRPSRAAFKKADVAEKLTARERQFRKSRVDVVEDYDRPPVCGSAHAVLSTASQARSMISIRPGGVRAMVLATGAGVAGCRDGTTTRAGHHHHDRHDHDQRGRPGHRHGARAARPGRDGRMAGEPGAWIIRAAGPARR